MRTFHRGRYFHGCLNIRPISSFEETAGILSRALGVSFSDDQESKYEEYPAYIARALGLELALLAPPRPEEDLRDIKDDNFQLLISTQTIDLQEGLDIDLSAFIESLLAKKTDLIMERIEHIHEP